MVSGDYAAMFLFHSFWSIRDFLVIYTMCLFTNVMHIITSFSSPSSAIDHFTSHTFKKIPSLTSQTSLSVLGFRPTPFLRSFHRCIVMSADHVVWCTEFCWQFSIAVWCYFIGWCWWANTAQRHDRVQLRVSRDNFGATHVLFATVSCCSSRVPNAMPGNASMIAAFSAQWVEPQENNNVGEEPGFSVCLRGVLATIHALLDL